MYRISQSLSYTHVSCSSSQRESVPGFPSLFEAHVTTKEFTGPSFGKIQLKVISQNNGFSVAPECWEVGSWHQVGPGLATLHKTPDNTEDAAALSLALPRDGCIQIPGLALSALPRATPVIGVQILPGWRIPSPSAEKQMSGVHLSTLGALQQEVFFNSPERTYHVSQVSK